MSLKRIQTAAFRVVSQTGIHYRNGSLSKSLTGPHHVGPRGGDRFPWLRLKLRSNGSVEDLFQKFDDTRFNLIVIGQSPPEGALGFGDQCRVDAIPADPVNDAELARVQISQPSFYLLRPDGHVGLCGGRLEIGEIKQYVFERLHFRV